MNENWEPPATIRIELRVGGKVMTVVRSFGPGLTDALRDGFDGDIEAARNGRILTLAGVKLEEEFLQAWQGR